MAEILNIEEYIKDLTPEQQEKARECKTKEELLQLAADEDIEIPMEALEEVAGGCNTSYRNCPQGGDHKWKKIKAFTYECTKCGKIIASSFKLDKN